MNEHDALNELRWVIENSEGVAGLRIDGTVMPWPEVLDTYAPSVPRSRQ